MFPYTCFTSLDYNAEVFFPVAKQLSIMLLCAESEPCPIVSYLLQPVFGEIQ